MQLCTCCEKQNFFHQSNNIYSGLHKKHFLLSLHQGESLLTHTSLFYLISLQNHKKMF